ncbi:MAG: hypothetical protein J6X07_11770 [Prevotella sp.]|nr:hypothetical protein [Prevotella sp.]
MKKFIVLMIVAMFMASCSEQQLFDEFTSGQSVLVNEQKVSESVILNSYLEKARWGDGTAFLRLAECYHDGIGVKPDFMGTLTMLMMADQYGVKNQSIEDYLISLPDTDNTKMAFEAIAKLDRNNNLSSDSIAELLIANGSAEGYTIKGVIQVEQGDTIGGQQSIETGAKMGSSFAELLLCAFPTPETRNGNSLNIEMLKSISEKSPVVNTILGDFYSGYNYGDTSNIDETLAEIYYKKADEQGCLGKRPARWLINYYDRTGIQIDAKEKERLQILSGTIWLPKEE